MALVVAIMNAIFKQICIHLATQDSIMATQVG